MEQRQIQLSDRIIRSSATLTTEIDKKSVVMMVDTGTFCGLDAVGTDIWNRLEQPCQVQELCAWLAEIYDASPEIIERDVLDLLASLLEWALIEVGS